MKVVSTSVKAAAVVAFLMGVLACYGLLDLLADRKPEYEVPPTLSDAVSASSLRPSGNIPRSQSVSVACGRKYRPKSN